jgi:hypothetical protein
LSKLSPARRRALEIVRDHPGTGGRHFAYLMWPDSPGWTSRSRRSGAGGAGAMAVGIIMRGGTFLAELWKAGLISPEFKAHGATDYRITEAGLDALREDASMRDADFGDTD